MAQKISKREEGLKELAGMIAKAYRRRITGETALPLNASITSEESPAIEAEMMARTEPADFHPGYVYKETVKVENFIRRKANQVGKTDREGGQNVADKGSFRDR